MGFHDSLSLRFARNLFSSIFQLASIFALAIVSKPGIAQIDSDATYFLVPTGSTSYELVSRSEQLLSIALPAWGPDWRWFGFFDQPRIAGGARVLESSPTIAGTDRTLSLAHRVIANEIDRLSVELSYDISSDFDSPLTMIAVAVSPNLSQFATLELLRPNGESERVELADTMRRDLGVVTGISFVSGVYGDFSFDLSRPVSVFAEGTEIRIVIVADQINRNSPNTLGIVVRAPSLLQFFRSAEEVEDTTDRTNWFPYPIGQYGTPVDLSFLNKDSEGNFVPAGANGFVRVDGERFVFEDGTEARFWGVNLTAGAAISSNRRAAELAERLSRLGINVVRLHHLDSWYRPIIDYGHRSETSQYLNSDSMRRLDRTIFELKNRGIYVILDPWVQRQFRPGDGIESIEQLGSGSFHLHPYIFFDQQMRELHKDFMMKFWTHVNEYTGVSYRDEPAIIFTGLANEALMQRGRGHVQVEPYRTEFVERYRAWARENGKSAGFGDAVIEENWPEQHIDFYIDLMRDFYTDMADYFRESVQLKISINASNWFLWHWETVSQSELDLMDAHLYYDGLTAPEAPGIGGLWLSHPPNVSGTPFGRIGAQHIFGKPLAITEVAQTAPRTYRAAYYPGLAAVASLQGWDAITAYAYSQSPESMSGFIGLGDLGAFEFEQDPATIAAFAIASIVYRRGDVAGAESRTLMHVDDEHMYGFQTGEGENRAFQNTGIFNEQLETSHVDVYFGESVPSELAEAAHTIITPEQSFAQFDSSQTQIESDTGELWRDWARGIGSIDTARTQLVYGLLGQIDGIQTQDASFSIETPFAVVSLSSLDDQPISSASRMLVTAVARAENTGTRFDPSNSRILDNGRAPVLAEPVIGSVRFRSNQSGYNVYPLRVDGSRGNEIRLPVFDGIAQLNLNADARTLFYLVETND